MTEGERYEVRLSPAFTAEANALFPVDGSTDNRASFNMFRLGPLAAAITAFSLGFETIPVAFGDSIRALVLPPSAFFSPLVFYGWLVSDGNGNACVELVSVINDPNYWDTIEGDPTD